MLKIRIIDIIDEKVKNSKKDVECKIDNIQIKNEIKII